MGETPMGRLLVLPATVLALCASPLAAQQGAERASIDSLLSQLESSDSIAQVPRATQCDVYRGAVRKTCRGLLALKRAEVGGAREDAVTAEFELVQVAREQPTWVVGWYGLGMARLELSRAKVIAKESLVQPTGMSFEAGAGNALVRGLEAEPTFAPALSALALISIPREGASVLGSRLATLRRHTTQLGAATLLGAAKVERVAGSRDSAVALLERALASGLVDSGVVRLEIARDLHAAGRSDEGRAALFAGVTHASPATQAAYRQELSWVAEPAELAAWDSLPVSERGVWLKRFWRSRDVKAGWPEGTRLIEHFARLEHAWQHFTLFLPRLGRHKLSGRTSGVDMLAFDQLNRRLAGAEMIDMVESLNSPTDDSPPGMSPSEMNAYVMLTGAIANSEMLKALGVEGPFRAFRTEQSVLDDRGVVWIRYGKPSRSGRTAGGEALEVWAYDNPEGEIVLQFREEDFDGQVGASMLVPSLLGTPGWSRDQFCGISRRFCALDTRGVEDRPLMNVGNPFESTASTLTDGGRINAGVIARDVAEGEIAIARATTTDAHPRPFVSPITPVVQLLGLRRSGGSSRVVAAFAIPGAQLTHHQPPGASGRYVYSVRFVLSVLDELGERTVLDTLRHFAVATPLRGDEHLTGMLELPVISARVDASLLVMQQDGRGTVAALGSLPLPQPGMLSLSSLVLGSARTGLRWQSGTTTVPLHPLNAFEAGAAAELYYQLGGLQAGATYQTRIELFPAEARRTDAALALSFSDEASAPFAEVQRTIGLGALAPGRYRIRVTVATGAGSVSEEGFLTVVKGGG
jgi:hypothetical protein